MNCRTGLLVLFTVGACLLTPARAEETVSPVVAEEFSLSSATVNFGDPVADHFNFDFDAPNRESIKLSAISVTYNSACLKVRFIQIHNRQVRSSRSMVTCNTDSMKSSVPVSC